MTGLRDSDITISVCRSASISSSGRVFLGAYAADVISPWQTCAAGPPPPVGRIACDTLGNYMHNARLDYVVRDLTTNVTEAVSTHPINTRNGFGGGFFGDYTDIAAGSDNVLHALWTDSNNQQDVVWFCSSFQRRSIRRTSQPRLHPSEATCVSSWKARPRAALSLLQ